MLLSEREVQAQNVARQPGLALLSHEIERLLGDRAPRYGTSIAFQLKEVRLAQCPGQVIPHLSGLLTMGHRVDDRTIETDVKAIESNCWHTKGSVSPHGFLVIGQHIFNCSFVCQGSVYNSWV